MRDYPIHHAADIRFRDHFTTRIELLRYLMNENKLKSVDLSKMLLISPSLVSDILNYRRGLSKEIIRKLADRFKVSQEFPQPIRI